jgi:hypothetical protein
MAGAGIGFLWYNTYPASVFMGDTGSLAIGAALGVVAIMVKQEIVLALVGGVFVMEALSVILQVYSYKTTRKRIFRMAPVHHHFELKGWAEPKIIVRFWIISIILALLAISTLRSVRWNVREEKRLRDRLRKVRNRRRRSCGKGARDAPRRAPKADVEQSLGRDPAADGFVHGRMNEKAAQGGPIVLSQGCPRRGFPGRRCAGQRPVWERARARLPAFGDLAASRDQRKVDRDDAPRGTWRRVLSPRVRRRNLGTPRRRSGEPFDWGVVEVSSFQLESIDAFRPKVAVLLNLTEDHSDRYKDFAAYAETKMELFRNQGATDAAVINVDDPEVILRADRIRAEKVPFSLIQPLSEGACLSGRRWSTATACGKALSPVDAADPRDAERGHPGGDRAAADRGPPEACEPSRPFGIAAPRGFVRQAAASPGSTTPRDQRRRGAQVPGRVLGASRADRRRKDKGLDFRPLQGPAPKGAGGGLFGEAAENGTGTFRNGAACDGRDLDEAVRQAASSPGRIS